MTLPVGLGVAYARDWRPRFAGAVQVSMREGGRSVPVVVPTV